MSMLDWILSSILFVVYLTCLFTVCYLTFQKGYTALAIIGIFFPLLWLIGALLPAKPGSPYHRQEAARLQALPQQGGQMAPPPPSGQTPQPGPGTPAAA